MSDSSEDDYEWFFVCEDITIFKYEDGVVYKRILANVPQRMRCAPSEFEWNTDNENIGSDTTLELLDTMAHGDAIEARLLTVEVADCARAAKAVEEWQAARDLALLEARAVQRKLEKKAAKAEARARKLADQLFAAQEIVRNMGLKNNVACVSPSSSGVDEALTPLTKRQKIEISISDNVKQTKCVC
jgi:hypothetical protein